MKIVVTGGRDFNEPYFVGRHLDKLHAKYRFTALVEGGARGVDRFAKHWARQATPAVIHISEQLTQDEWDQYGKMAGAVRNGRMLRIHTPALVIAFPGGSGTANCVELAEALGIDIVRIGR